MKLKEIRKSRKITQQEVAEKLNCDVTTYARYENGDRNPPLDILLSLSELFDVTLDYFVGREPCNNSCLTQRERELLQAVKNADERATEDAILLLQKHKK